MSARVRLADRTRFSAEKMQKVPVFSPAPASMLCDVYCLSPGQAQKVHVHAGNDKVMLCISGNLTATIGVEEVALVPGTAVHAPAGVAHGLRNDAAIEGVVLVVTSPRP